MPLFERLLPRHMQIIYEINAQLLKEARNEHGMDDAEIRNVSLIDEKGERRVRMGNLAFVGAHSINGVSALHSELLKVTRLQGPAPDVPDPDQQQDQRHHAAALADAVQSRADRAHLRHDRRPASSTTSTRCATSRTTRRIRRSRTPSREVKRLNKDRLAQLVRDRMGIRIDPNALFDIQIKRIHEYKRQLLNIIETVALYDQIRSHPEMNWVPRVKIFAGKAAPTYYNAKLIIKLANDVARVINSNPTVSERAEGGVRAELQRQPRRGAGAGRRPFRADLDRRHGGVAEPAT